MAQTLENSKGKCDAHQEAGPSSANRAFRCEIGLPRASPACQYVGPAQCGQPVLETSFLTAFQRLVI